MSSSNVWPWKSSPRRRSSLPKHHHSSTSTSAPWDPFEKSARHSTSGSTLDAARAVWMNQSRHARYVKVGAVVTFFVLIYWYLAGGGSVSQPHNVYTTADSPTPKCTRPHDLSKPLVQYTIMIDAGSTGSRIHVYRFNNCGATPELEDEAFKMTDPKPGGSGLSSYGADPEAAARSLDPLMQVALERVPDDYKRCTPVAVKATAGLRLLGDEMSLKILDAVRTRLETEYPFPVVSKGKGGVEIMKGEDEGVFAWITTNYLLGKIGGPDKTPTAAIFDLGGGSTQIVFQPTFPGVDAGGMPEKMRDGDHRYHLQFGGRDFELYQHSHLGYGLMSARKALHAHVVEAFVSDADSVSSWKDELIPNPCITPGEKKTVNVTFEGGHPLTGTHEITMQGAHNALPAQCRALAEAILYKDKACNLAPCSFNGVHQPSLSKTFAREDVYIFSYFYDRTAELGMPESFTIRELHELTAKVCSGPKTWEEAFGSVPKAVEELRGREESCLDLSFMEALLHTGYDFPIDREVRIAKKIKGNELGWCLGASLPLLEAGSGWECKIREVS